VAISEYEIPSDDTRNLALPALPAERATFAIVIPFVFCLTGLAFVATAVVVAVSETRVPEYTKGFQVIGQLAL
jgi:hypothetical protein